MTPEDAKYDSAKALAGDVDAFLRRWSPQESYPYDFMHDLNALIYRAMAVAREPLEAHLAALSGTALRGVFGSLTPKSDT